MTRHQKNAYDMRTKQILRFIDREGRGGRRGSHKATDGFLDFGFTKSPIPLKDNRTEPHIRKNYPDSKTSQEGAVTAREN